MKRYFEKLKYLRIVFIVMLITILASSIGFASSNKVTIDGISENTKSYVLAFSSGNKGCDNVDKIVLKYKSDQSHILTQILYPAATKNDYESEATMGAFFDNNNLGLSLLGSRYTTYYPIMDLTEIKDNSEFIINVFGCAEGYLDQYLPYNSVVNASKSLIFRENTVEYLHFRTEEEIETLLELDIIMSNDGGDDWVLKNWKLYEVKDFKSTSDTSGTYYSDGSNNFEYTGPKMFSYAKTSASLGLQFDGTLIASYTDVNLTDTNINWGVDNLIFLAGNGETEYNDSSSTGASIDFSQYMGDFKTFSANLNESYTSNPATYLIRVKLSDEIGAGISSLIAYNKGSSTVFNDSLYATIHYTCSDGQNEVYVPIISSSLIDIRTLKAATNNSENIGTYLLNDSVVYYAQEGDSIFFTVSFPDCNTIDDIQLEYTNLLDPSDTVTIEKIEAYKGLTVDSLYNNYAQENTSDPLVIDLDFISDQTAALESYHLDGVNVPINNGESYTFNMVTPNTTASSQTLQNTYLVALTTDNVSGAGTEEEVYIKIKYIDDTTGTEKTTTEYKLSELIQEFYGENLGIIKNSTNLEEVDEILAKLSTSEKPGWIGSSEINIPKVDGGYYSYITGYSTDANYIYHMSSGQTIKFPIEIKNVRSFTGIEFRMDNCDDVWQLNGISIGKISSLGDRNVKYIGNQSSANVEYRFGVDRDVTFVTETIFSKTDIGLLLQKSDTKLYSFDTDVITGTEKSRDYTDKYYSMDYETARSNLSFRDTSQSYNVIVDVASNSSSGSSDDGTGSNNLFYFQLVFEKGTSSVVLANSQLSSDGFRAGKQESFTIITNEDYGKVTAIRIIPDDISDDSSKLDKLCINNIQVVQKNYDSQNMIYLFENVGWINMEYVDSAIKEDSDGRSLEDLATVVKVSSYSYVTTLEFAIVYEGYNEGDPQFEGDIAMELTYLNSDNEKKTLDSQWISGLMYEYSRRNYRISTSGTHPYDSDPEFMFRGNTTDRFQIDVYDISSILSIKLTGISKYETTLKIKEIQIKVVNGTGNLKLNSKGEYIMEYNIDPLLFDTSVTNRSFPASFNFTANNQTSYYLKFADNTVPTYTTATTSTDLVSRLPQSTNDTMNLFIYMKNESQVKDPTDGNYTMTTTIEYSSATTGYNYRTTVSSYNKDDTSGQIILSATGLSAKNMSNLNYVKITQNGLSQSSNIALIDHVIIQQVRSNTVISTYEILLNGSDVSAKNGISMVSATTKENGETIQKVSLLFEGDGSSTSLVAEKQDIAVCLKYTSKLNSGSFTSEYVYLTDFGVYAVAGGTIATLEFTESELKEITGITIANNTGNTGIKVKSAIVEVYEPVNETQALIATYSLNPANSVLSGDMNVTYKPGDAAYEVNSLHHVQFIFNTMSAEDLYNSALQGSDQIDSNGSAPIKMLIHYVYSDDLNIYENDLIIDDIRKCAGTDSSFTQGGSATVNLYVPGIERISYIQILPISGTNPASWNLKSLTYSISDTQAYSDPRTIMINSKIPGGSDVENAYKYGLSTINVALSVVVTGSSVVSKTVQGTSETIAVKSNASISIGVNVAGSVSNKYYKYKVDKIVGAETVPVQSYVTGPENGFALNLTPPDGTDTVTYRVTVCSGESESSYSTVTFVVSN